MEDNNSPDDGNKTSIDRRTYLTLAGSVAGATAIAGCSSVENTPAVTDTQLRYGFGGSGILLSTSSTALTETEPNDACGDATSIETDTTVSGALDSAEVDWFSVDLAAGESFDVVFDRVPENGVTNVVISGPGCTFKTLRQVGTNQEVRVSATADEAGTHYVEIVDIEQGDGDYTVYIDTDDTGNDTGDDTTIENDFGEQGYGAYGYGGTA